MLDSYSPRVACVHCTANIVAASAPAMCNIVAHPLRTFGASVRFAAHSNLPQQFLAGDTTTTDRERGDVLVRQTELRIEQSPNALTLNADARRKKCHRQYRISKFRDRSSRRRRKRNDVIVCVLGRRARCKPFKSRVRRRDHANRFAMLPNGRLDF